MPNIISLPTYEQVEGIKKTVENMEVVVNGSGGIISGTDNEHYKANFDDAYRTYLARDVGNSEIFKKSFEKNFDAKNTSLNGNNIFYFLYLFDRYRFSYGQVANKGVSSLYYIITDSETFEVITGGVVEDAEAIVVQNSYLHTCLTYNDKYIFLYLTRGGHATIAIFDRSSFKFIKYHKLRSGVNSPSMIVGQLSITNDNVIGIMHAGGAYLHLYSLNVDGNGLPIDSTTLPQANDYGISVGGTTGQQAAALFSDGEFFYLSTTPSGNQCRVSKIKFNRNNRLFSEIAYSVFGNAPNPVPPAILQFVHTTSDNRRILVKVHRNGNFNYYASVNMDTMGYIQFGQFVNSEVVFDGSNMYTTDDPASFISIGSAVYIPFRKLSLNENGSYISENIWSQATETSGNPSSKGSPTTSGIANSRGMFVSPNGVTKFREFKRVYNLTNYERVSINQ